MKATCLVLTLFLVTSCGELGVRSHAAALEGVVQYEGDLDGTLEVSVFRSFPPRGAPIAVHRAASPAFPHHYAFHDLPPGRYYVLAMLDRNPDDGAAFHPTLDPGGAHGGFTSPVSVLLTAARSVDAVDVQLVEPSPDSPWIRRNYR